VEDREALSHVFLWVLHSGCPLCISPGGWPIGPLEALIRDIGSPHRQEHEQLKIKLEMNYNKWEDDKVILFENPVTAKCKVRMLLRQWVRIPLGAYVCPLFDISSYSRKGHVVVWLSIRVNIASAVPWLRRLSRRPLTEEFRVRARVNPFGIWGGRSGTTTGFSPSSSVFPCQYHFIVVLHIHISSGGWTVSPLVAAVQRRSLDPS
jgi:hypothetical protein